jgi:hypothetical protein
LDNDNHVEMVVCLSNKNAKPKDYAEIGVDVFMQFELIPWSWTGGTREVRTRRMVILVDTGSNEIAIVDKETVENLIYIVRGQKVMLDTDLAKIYGYSTKAFNQQVKNNILKFGLRKRN